MVLAVIGSRRAWNEHLNRLAEQFVSLVTELAECGGIHHHNRATLVGEQHAIGSGLHHKTVLLLAIEWLYVHSVVFPSISPSFR